MPMPTLATVIIPTFNRAHLVRDAIDSALQQATSDLEVEVIVVDDGSTDATGAVLASYGPRIRAITKHNRGASASRNTGLDAAQGAWVKFLDSDDLLLPNTLAQEASFGAATETDIVVSGWSVAQIGADQPERTHEAPFFSSIPDDLLAGRAVPTSSALYATRIAQRARWDEALKKLDDWDYFCSAALLSRNITTMGHVAYIMRDHAGPRLTRSTMALNAIEHHHILAKLEQSLLTCGMLTEARRHRLAQYFYKELRVLELHDTSRFEAACARILNLDPSFTPRDEEPQWYMRLAARMLGFRNSTRLHGRLKRMLSRRATA